MTPIPWWELRGEAKKRMKQRRVVGSRRVVPQTYRITVRLECGHVFSYTKHERRVKEGDLGPDKMWCDLCLEAEAKHIQAENEAALLAGRS